MAFILFEMRLERVRGGGGGVREEKNTAKTKTKQKKPRTGSKAVSTDTTVKTTNPWHHTYKKPLNCDSGDPC